MELTALLADMLGGETAGMIRKHQDALTELRLRIGRPALLVLRGGQRLSGEPIGAETFDRLLNRLMRNSLYACERELKQGYFTTMGGCRVGICGRVNADGGGVDGMGSIGSVCIRIPRQVRGCASVLAQCLQESPNAGMLILSPPGMGKTTMLRDLVRLLSECGRNVALCDERREIAACLDAVPQLDVGPSTDVLDGLPKALGVPMLVRACAPDVIASDEIGGPEDAHVLLDAVRSGITVVATAHAPDIETAAERPGVGLLLKEKVFHYCAVLGPKPGQIKSLRRCANERFVHAQGGIARIDPAVLHGSGKVDIQHAQMQV